MTPEVEREYSYCRFVVLISQHNVLASLAAVVRDFNSTTHVVQEWKSMKQGKSEFESWQNSPPRAVASPLRVGLPPRIPR